MHTNREVTEYVLAGNRIPKLSQCSDELYEVMLNCWKDDPVDRPNFKGVLERLSGIHGETLDSIYEDTTAPGSNSYYKTMEQREYSNNAYTTISKATQDM